MDMNLHLYDFEKNRIRSKSQNSKKLTDEEINDKYEKGDQRIITEQGSYKLNLLPNLFSSKNYTLQPAFQRRITWDNKKRSKLIESFIMNVPVPPVFLYEEDFSNYVVMDGLQRISAIIDFYKNSYELCGLEEWSELNGKTYSQLPNKIREGIDRRQLSVITLLKESTDGPESADKMKRTVFERLNTGGIQLEDQEIRNALYQGPFNAACIELSETKLFRKLWRLEGVSGKDSIEYSLDVDANLMAEKNRMIRRMYDVELVLRYFALRDIYSFNGKLNRYLDEYLKNANLFTIGEIVLLKNDFISSVNRIYQLFGDNSFCIFKKEKGWTQPQNMIYDALMICLNDERILSFESKGSVEDNLLKLQEFYIENEDSFNGRKQSRKDIINRVNMLTDFILKKL